MSERPQFRPVFHFVLTVGLILVAELLIMIALQYFTTLSSFEKALLDSILLVIVISPVFYFKLVKPFITDRMRAEENLKRSERNYRSLVESTEDSIYLVDRNCNYLFMNRKHRERLGLLNAHVTGRSFTEFHSQQETDMFRQKIDRVFSTGESAQYEYKSLRDGRHFLQTYSPVRDDDGDPAAVTVISKNITMLKQMEEELRTLSYRDDLTGLYNRRGFFTLAEHQLKLAKRERKYTFFLYADLDNLKWINDSFGHQEGDTAIIETADILKATYRESDIIGRIGGDEFAIYPVATNEKNADIIAARLQKNLELHNAHTTRPYKLSISTGIVSCDPDLCNSIDELLAQADKLMYRNKRQKV